MNTKVKNLYSGKPDARDELSTPNSPFFKSFIMPPNFELEDILEGDKCFIRGYKGSGKTALLLYINDYIHQKDENAVSSFMYFKEYTNIDRNHMDIVTSKYRNQTEENVVFDKKTLLKEQSFIYIWRWLLYSRIIEDNITNNYSLFEKNSAWNSFVKKISKITYDKIGDKAQKFPAKLKIQAGYADYTLASDISFSAKVNVAAYEAFVSVINDASEDFVKLNKTDTPYYIFLDELEAYYSDEVLFRRDLTMLRDLIFVVKDVNNIFLAWGNNKAKIVCSIRTEVINSINKFIPAKELNKATSGYEKVLSWNYNNTTAYQHPIFQVLLKRIELAELKNGNTFSSQEELFKKWFPMPINERNPVEEIITMTWYKPRDIVRLIIAAQNSIASNAENFSQDLYTSLTEEYSSESLKEVKEELNILYTPEEMEEIISLFRGFNAVFSLQDLKNRITNNYLGTIWETKLNSILSDLYRVGFLGNLEWSSGTNAWQHRGNDGPVFNDDWGFVVHRALRKTLLVSGKQDKQKRRIPKIEIGEIVEAKIVKIYKTLILATFDKNEWHFNAAIKNPKYYYVEDQVVRCVVKDYDREHKKWILEIE